MPKDYQQITRETSAYSGGLRRLVPNAMCVYMGGGPALMNAADALRAYDQFAAI